LSDIRIDEAKKKINSLVKSEFGHSPLLETKDPRLCRLLPVWLPAIRTVAEPKVILTIRHPQEVASSLNRRNGIPKERAYLLWLLHTLEAEHVSREFGRAVVHFRDLVNDGLSVIAAIANDLDIDLSLDPRRKAEINGFLEPDLMRFKTKDVAADSLFERLSLDVYQLFLNQDINTLISDFDTYSARAHMLTEIVAPWAIKNRQLETKLERLQQDARSRTFMSALKRLMGLSRKSLQSRHRAPNPRSPRGQ